MKTKFFSLLTLAVTLFSATVFTACSKDDKPGGGDSNVAAAQRLAGTYKGTIKLIDSEGTYYDAEIIITKESGSTVNITPKSGQPYSGLTAKTTAVQGLNGTQDVEALTASVTLAYLADTKSITFNTQKEGQRDVRYNFEGTKQ